MLLEQKGLKTVKAYIDIYGMNLTQTEQRVARYIAARWSFEAIVQKLDIEHVTLRIHVRNIRQKLGISTFNPHKLKKLLGLMREKRDLSKAEREVLTLRSEGKPFKEIARIRGCALSTVLNISSQGCRKLGLKRSTNTGRLLELLNPTELGTHAAPQTVNTPSTNPNDY